MSNITFQYITVDTLTTSSSVLQADDLAPMSVVKSSGSVWNVSYSKDEIYKKASRIKALYNIFLSSSQSSSYNNQQFLQLRIDFCLQPETYPSLFCPSITDYNNLNTNTCSRLYSTNNDFNNQDLSNVIKCNQLINYLDIDDTNEDMKTAVQTGYKQFCTNYKTMKECQCYNRADFDAYKNAKAVLSYSSSTPNECCWYTPCNFQNNITVDPNLLNAYNKIQCPNVCQNIVAAVNVKNAVFSDISLKNECFSDTTNSNDISSKVKDEDATPLFNSLMTTTPTPSITTTSVMDTKTLIISIVLGAIVVILIITMIVLIFKEKGTPN